MSPIGRVFIVLNLLLAGTFVGFSGTYLQQANHWKQKHEAKDKELAAEKTLRASERQNADAQLGKTQMEKSVLDNQLANLKQDRERLVETNKTLEGRLSSTEADLKALNASANANREEVKQAFGQAKAAYDMAIADQKTRDTAVRERDDSVAKLRDANTKIAGLEENVRDRDLKIAALNKDVSEKDLLIAAARIRGFLDSMATPSLAGTISHVSGNLVTISITDNPNKADIKPGYSFAIYDANVYKGEAKVTEAADGMAFCRVDRAKEGTTIKVGDRATTQTN